MARRNSSEPRITTKQRILDTSLELFNANGERNVTTNHIADAVGISPGNLYYHYKNKAEIIYALFERYQAYTEGFMQVPPRAFNWKDKMMIFEAIFQSLLKYRFLHRDLHHLLQQDDRLREAYQSFVERALTQARMVFESLHASELIEATPDELESLMINIWVVVTSWPSFLDAVIFDLGDENMQKALIARGIYQIIMLEEPYLRGDALKHVPEYKEKFSQVASLLSLLQKRHES